MAFILWWLVSVLLLITVDAAKFAGKYYVRSGSEFTIYVKEDNSVYVIYRCLTPRVYLAGPYQLRPGSGENEYTIGNSSSPGSNILDLMSQRCPDVGFVDGDLHKLNFTSEGDALTTSLRNFTTTVSRIDNSNLIPYNSTYFGLEIEWYVLESDSVKVTVVCGVQEVTGVLLFEPDGSRGSFAQFVIGWDGIEAYDEFKDGLLTVCGVELEAYDFMTVAYATPTTSFTELRGQRLTLTAI
ncbi:hypothetical protein FOZ61_005485 [Perkinsus olseni]|uniref:Uncharacterized protein n=1 Tax=Perkinsus olseni TaxID=32597 RepID=A0A7J6LWT9_PEROL|nr:hypothetical protein FOZ61_005485 [Perkinsus olseni]KAF4663430.1 hypothetical protein FOL46_004785 [Perkinsus olseni]